MFYNATLAKSGRIVHVVRAYQTLYRQLCRDDETPSVWPCKGCSRLPQPLTLTDDSFDNMVNVLHISKSTPLTADKRHDVHIPTYSDLIYETMNADFSINVNDSDMPIDNFSVQSIHKLTLQLRQNHERQPDFQNSFTGLKMSRLKLVEADGYPYTVKRKRAGVTYWWRCRLYEDAMTSNHNTTWDFLGERTTMACT
ncbi:hypothetical protein CHS0354_039937 [Potamilus streckersoni]|uniref:Uncharacterized protein n=1 Tax=Potamilus streckersoni TaxID=2493646 RepID=A0AAE0WCZ6_9BIVA|nr:hypothetical protein CHS0354_039937 [Potamilus streckersoni]